MSYKFLKRLMRCVSGSAFLFCISAMAQIPNATKVVIPKYPMVAIASKLQGKIKFEFDLTPDGSVGSVVVVESFTKVTAVTKPLIEALSRWQFLPGTNGNYKPLCFGSGQSREQSEIPG